jgi:peptidylprolyl isomerase
VDRISPWIAATGALAVLGTIAWLTFGMKRPERQAPIELAAAPSGSASVGAAVQPPKPVGREIPPQAAVADADLHTEPFGLQWADITVGTGEPAAKGQTVSVDYTGWLKDGTMFDSSFKRANPFKFPIGQGKVIQGWDLGVAGMKVGGKRRLVIPGPLAYGPHGRPPTIPPDATLVFDIELRQIHETRTAPASPTALPDGAYVHSSTGLKLHDFEVGTGNTAKPGDTVAVDYTGWTTDGKKFDSSLDRPDPIRFPLGQGRVIKGWDEGIAGMRVGGRRQLVIPPEIAYGAQGRPPVIPPNATLIFEVTLVEAP